MEKECPGGAKIMLLKQKTGSPNFNLLGTHEIANLMKNKCNFIRKYNNIALITLQS